MVDSAEAKHGECQMFVNPSWMDAFTLSMRCIISDIVSKVLVVSPTCADPEFFFPEEEVGRENFVCRWEGVGGTFLVATCSFTI